MMTKFQISEEVILEWEKDLASIQHGDTIRIVSGEAAWPIYRALKDKIVVAAQDLHAKFLMIVGPIVSIEDKSGTNAIFELSEAGLLDLFISPYRQLSHFRVVGDHLVYREHYHGALDKHRTGERFTDSLSVSKFSYTFNTLIRILKMDRYGTSSLLIKSSIKDIMEVKEICGIGYDFLGQKRMSEMDNFVSQV